MDFPAGTLPRLAMGRRIKDANMFEVRQGLHGALLRACRTAAACKRRSALQGKRVGLRPRLRIVRFGNPRSGQWLARRLLLLTFLGETRKVSSRRATPGNRASSKKEQRQVRITANEEASLDSPLQGASEPVGSDRYAGE
jgi:hypothetical protein